MKFFSLVRYIVLSLTIFFVYYVNQGLFCPELCFFFFFEFVAFQAGLR